ncbi:hypothetical protein E3P92_02535 [Wallemia ichthyophaga]|uniref:Uncharacterized protein n=2 Tax=Wallemia ichthyophaga TaxID=245174 RepID=A0A4T0E6D5_WALIC|nr:hypothetical protein E3P91_03686 [Wallemia ichthyophaga]TIA81031.1 hypothetical protein E3P98_02292 [Wallemia ichthyophaga]TIA98855.1 hypothetical protein E3P95_02257 [Wallemia ichthyophaga]TIB00074.1 hypothetical protein E3P94_02314 [Wallemia ichthyophaga]TIB08216.1 hypothetical protein E3P93_03578 [Wallemia ichthyophaga]
MMELLARQHTNGHENNDDGQTTHQLFIIIFLIVIAILLAVSSGLILRTWYLRRRALHLGLPTDQPRIFPFFTNHTDHPNNSTEMSNINNLGNKPELFEVFIDKDSRSNVDYQRPFAATISVPQSMTHILQSSDNSNDENNPSPGWLSAAARLALFSKPRSRFWPPIYRGRDDQYERRQRLQALADLSRQRQEDERQRRLQLENPVKSLPPPIKNNVSNPTISLSMLVQLPTKPQENSHLDDLPDICIGLTESNLSHNSPTDIEHLVSI